LYKKKEEEWEAISKDAQNFLRALLEVDPRKRLTAKQALVHPWICKNPASRPKEVSRGVAEAFRQFRQASLFRRCCMEILAWSLSNEDRAKVRETFLSLDTRLQGAITLGELQSVMLQVMDESEALQIIKALDYNHDKEIHYSDFLAACVNTQTQITLNRELLLAAFRRFDTDGLGFLTLSNLKDVHGSLVVDVGVEAFLKSGRISLSAFLAFLRGEKPEISIEDLPCLYARDCVTRRYSR
jgi:calcium-dependent protein kinase